MYRTHCLMTKHKLHGLLQPSLNPDYQSVDLEIERCTEEVKLTQGQPELAKRGKAYKAKAFLAQHKDDKDVFTSNLHMALNDYNKALSMGDKGQLAKAEWYQQRGILYKALADTLVGSGKKKLYMESAVDDFTNALHIAHNTTEVLYLRGDARLALAFYEAAIDDFTSVIPSATAQGKIQALVGRSNAWMALKDYRNAYDDLTQAIGVCMVRATIDEQQLSSLLFARGKVSGLMNHVDKFLVDVGKALELCPDNTEALETRSTLCYALGMYSEAETDLCDALKLGAGTSDVLSSLYKKLKKTQAVVLTILEAKNLTLPSTRKSELYVSYRVSQVQDTMRPIVEGRTLTMGEANWNEMIHLELPTREYVVDFTVRDESHEADCTFLGKCSIDLSMRPDSKGSTWMALHPQKSRRNDVVMFKKQTGGEGTLLLSWTMVPRLLPDPPVQMGAGQSSGILCNDQELSSLFAMHDTYRTGYLPRKTVIDIYNSFDNFGVPREDAGRILDGIQRDTSMDVSLDEFTLLMLRITRR